MRRHVAVQLKVIPSEGRTSGRLLLQDVDAVRALPVSEWSWVLCLDLEAGGEDTFYAHGYIRTADNTVSYPIRSNRLLFDALCEFVDSAEGPE